MKTVRNISIFLAILLTTLFIGQSAVAASEKILEVGSASVNNLGIEDDSREVILDLKTTNCQDVNGLVFTLGFDASVFEYVGLVKSIKPIDNQDHAGEATQPSPETIKGTIYYQDNAANSGRALIAAAGAQYFTDKADPYVPFKVKFRVKKDQGSGIYPITLQQTIIGPATAANAGYETNVRLAVAAGLAPDADPSTAESFPVTLKNGTITVSGGYSLSGTVKYGADPAEGVNVALYKKTGAAALADYRFVSSVSTAADGAYSFTGQPMATYKIRVKALKPGFQNNATTEDIVVDKDTVVDPIVLQGNAALTGKVEIQGRNDLPKGLKVRVYKEVNSKMVLVGEYNVDAAGNFVSAPLPTGPAYTLKAVYGGVESAAVFKDGKLVISDLPLVNLTVNLVGMNSKTYMVYVIQEDGKLSKQIKDQATKDPEPVIIPDLISGKNYRVSVVGDGIPVTFFDAPDKQTTVYSESDLIAVTAATPAVTFDFSQKTIKTITGTVKKGTGFAAIEIMAVSSDFTNVYTAMSAADTGDYSLEVIPGKYTVYGIYKGVAYYYMTATESSQKYLLRVLVDASENAANINIILAADDTYAYFKGKVTEKRSDGNPVPLNLILAESSKRVAVGETSEKGEYRLQGFADGEKAGIYLPAYPDSKQEATAVNEGTEVNFIVNQGFTVSGKVQKSDDDTALIGGATIYLKDTTGRVKGLPVKSSTGTGAFTLNDVKDGIYTINAVHPSYKKYTDDIEVQGDKTGVTVKMESGAAITGTVTDSADQSKIPGAGIVVFGDQKTYRTQTNNEGAYEVKGLNSALTYKVFAAKEGYVPKFANSVAPSTDGTVQPFALDKVQVSYTVGGTIKAGNATVADGTRVTLYSVLVNAYKITTTKAGQYSFTGVVGSTDYVLMVKQDDMPVVKYTIGTIDADVTDKDFTIQTSDVTGTVGLEGNATGKTVTVYILSLEKDVLGILTAEDKGNGEYGYTFPGVTGETYKVAAFCEGYDLKWYNGQADFSSADAVTPGTPAAKFTLPTAN